MKINEAVTAIDAFLRSYQPDGIVPKEVTVFPSGDELNTIKIWVDLGTTPADPKAWRQACDAAIAAAIPESTAYKLIVRVETD